MKAVNVVRDIRDPIRPVQGEKYLDPPQWRVLDPILQRWIVYPSDQVHVLGEWDGPSGFHLGGKEATWSQYAHHQLGVVMKQNALADKLNELGYNRFQQEPYIIDQFYASYRYRFQFTFDELDGLLSRLQ